MYLPKHFAETDIAVMHELIRAFPLATIVTHGPNGFDANHVPLHLDATVGQFGCLRGHIARANPLSKGATVHHDILIIFQGFESYISPSNYATKAEHGKVVPTWNYTAVHAYGALNLIDEPDWIMSQLKTLTATHEKNLPQPWAVNDAPADYIEKMLGAIVGIEIPIDRLFGKWKVSQNQPAANQASLISALEKSGNPMADLVRAKQQ
jgi:transcriptional regulator